MFQNTVKSLMNTVMPIVVVWRSERGNWVAVSVPE